jgi:glycosyltransferase involved in cell wall biosynthesis
MIGVVVPAHNEERLIKFCLESLLDAAAHPALDGEAVEIIVVLDACTDQTGPIAQLEGVTTLSVDSHNVGLARQHGAAKAITLGARWLAFTDADCVVAADWLITQLNLKADAVCGTVAVNDWGFYGDRMQQHFASTYNDTDGHQHIHGANMGVSVAAYLAVGGFAGLSSSEDVALVEALRQHGAAIAWSSAPRVVTSVRQDYKAPGGFGATLERIETLGQWAAT